MLSYIVVSLPTLLLPIILICADESRSDQVMLHDPQNRPLRSDTLRYSSGIRSIFQDSKGHYWFGSLKEGVCRYDGEQFTYYTVDDGLSDPQVITIQEDARGRVWFGTQHGVTSYEAGRMTAHTLGIQTGLQVPWTWQADDLWFHAGTQEGVYRYDGHKLDYLPFPDTKVSNPNNRYQVTGIYEGQDMLWFATYAGVFGYDGREFTVINDETLGRLFGVPPLHIRSILEDSRGRLWIGNNGIGVLLKDEGKITNFSASHGLIHPGSGGRGDRSPPGTMEHVFTITEDRHGHLWFGDRDAGIWRYDGRTMTNYTQADGLSSTCAQSIYEDRNGELWFGMANGHVFTFNGRTFDRRF